MKKAKRNELKFEAFETSRISNATSINGKGDGDQTKLPKTTKSCATTINE